MNSQQVSETIVHSGRRPWHIPMLLVAAGIVLIPGEDAWAGQAMHFANRYFLGTLDKWLSIGEKFPSFEGLVLVGLIIIAAEKSSRERITRYLAGIGVICLVTGPTKVLFGRQRPEFYRKGEYERRMPAEEAGHWFGEPGNRLGSLFDSSYHAFPSGHSLSAAFLATMLSSFYPRGRYIWWALALFAMAHRFDNSRHYLSDCLVGAAMGITIAYLVLPGGFLAQRAEAWLARRRERRDSAK